MSKPHDLFLLMLNLAQVQGRGLVLDLFCQALGGMWPELGFRYAPDGACDSDHVLHVGSQTRSHGCITVMGPWAELPDEHRMLVRNGVQLLAVILDRDAQARELEGRRATLEHTVSAQSEAIARGEERLRLALDAVNDGLWDWDVSTDEAFFSPRYFTMLGYEPDEFPHTFATWQRLLHPDDLERCTEIAKLHVREGMDFCMEFRLRAKDGGWRWILARGAVVRRDGSGNVARVIGTHVDITERKDMEARLVESEAKYRALIDATETGFVILDEQGRVRDANREFSHLAGEASSDAMRGRDMLEWVDPRLIDEVRLGLAQCLDTGEVRNLETRFTGAPDKGVPVEMFGRAVSTNTGRQIIMLCRDISERRRTQELLIQTEKMLSVGGLAAGMAHEINNPLAGVLQGVQNVRRRLLDRLAANEEAARLSGISLEGLQAYMEMRHVGRTLDSIQEAGARAARIVANMLDFSRRSVSRKNACDLNVLLDRVIELASNDYSHNKKYDFKKISVVKEFDAALPAVACVDTEMEQVFFNLVKNAAQAMEAGMNAAREGALEGRGSLAMLTLRTRKAGDLAVVDVEDTGPGMDEGTRGRIFEPFFTTKPSGIGTGLGLSVSYFIVTQNHGGTIDVCSAPGKGTRFTVSLPIGELP